MRVPAFAVAKVRKNMRLLACFNKMFCCKVAFDVCFCLFFLTLFFDSLPII